MIAVDAADRSYIRSSVLSGFAEFVEPRGGSPADLLRRAGIDPAALSTPDMLISYRRKGLLLEEAARELGIATFGLEWALSMPGHFPNAGPVLFLKDAAPTFGAWIEKAVRYWSVQTNAAVPLAVPKPDSGIFAVRMTSRRQHAPSRQQMKYFLGSIVRLSRAILLDDELTPARVRFRHPQPESVAIHDLLFRCPVEFDADQDEIWFHQETLARPIQAEANAVEALAQEFLRGRIRQLTRYAPSVLTSTALAIRTVLGAGICSKDFIAHSLGSSPRKLQRLLAGEGTTYEEVLDSVRREIACQLLADTTAPVAAIGGMLDFASPAALTLAMRRWTGMTPSDYRRNTPTGAAIGPA